MFPHLIEKLGRHEDLTMDEASAAMGEVMDGTRRAGADCRPADRPRDERRAAGGNRRPRADDARPCGADRDAIRSRLRHLRHRRRSIGHLQYFLVRRAGRRGVRRARGEARQPVGVEPVGQRRRLRGARRPRVGRRRPWSSVVSPTHASVSSSPRRSIRRCGMPPRRAAISACGPRSICSGRSPIRPAPRASWSGCRGPSSPS